MKINTNDLSTLRQYIYNVVCACEGSITEKAIQHELFQYNNIIQCVTKGLMKYEKLRTTSLVHKTEDKYETALCTHRTLCANTQHEQLALRIVLGAFQLQGDYFVSQYYNAQLKIHTDVVLRDRSSFHTPCCTDTELKVYTNLFSELNEQTVSLCFLYSLGMQI